jgi:4-alpha-glucanotransferase
VKFPRSCGLLLHLTSLPGEFGIGDLGPQAREFADFLESAGQKLWQVLPIHPTGYGDSPYQCFSAFAGNPLLLSLADLRDRGLLTEADLADPPGFPLDAVDFEAASRYKLPLLTRAAERFIANASGEDRAAFKKFCQSTPWLEEFALFMALKEAHDGVAWTRWEPALRDHDPQALGEFAGSHEAQLETIRFWQYEFFRQWRELKRWCSARSIRLMGDVPIYVAHDSADVWARPDLFHLDSLGRPTVVSGVPPDYFSSTGQLWGNPIYRWDLMRQDGFAWWIARVGSALKLFDLIRLDHFRGFEAYWEVGGSETTAMNGRWVNAPGEALLEALEKEFGELPIVAENLGVITPAVEGLRHRFNLPGMSILQFAFGNDPQGPSFRPHNYTRDLVAYTGSHDNDTAQGWWNSGVGAGSTRTEEDVRKEHGYARAYLNLADETQIHWALIRTVFSSIAETVIVPVQDVLGLGGAARMNLPGTVSGNWKWRCRPKVLDDEAARRLSDLAELYER